MEDYRLTAVYKKEEAIISLYEDDDHDFIYISDSRDKTWVKVPEWDYDIDEYDERLLRHLALGYTKEMITNLKGMPFGVKSIEKRQNELINRLFTLDERSGVNACRLVTRAFELRILDIDNLEPDEE